MHQEYGWKYQIYHWICTDENRKQRLDHIKKELHIYRIDSIVIMKVFWIRWLLVTLFFNSKVILSGWQIHRITFLNPFELSNLLTNSTCLPTFLPTFSAFFHSANFSALSGCTFFQVIDAEVNLEETSTYSFWSYLKSYQRLNKGLKTLLMITWVWSNKSN